MSWLTYAWKRANVHVLRSAIGIMYVFGSLAFKSNGLMGTGAA